MRLIVSTIAYFYTKKGGKKKRIQIFIIQPVHVLENSHTLFDNI